MMEGYGWSAIIASREGLEQEFLSKCYDVVVLTREGQSLPRRPRAGAFMHAVLNLHAEILLSLVFLGSHEFDAHFLGAAWNRSYGFKEWTPPSTPPLAKNSGFSSARPLLIAGCSGLFSCG
jgi:hypothetical protein